VLCLQGHLLVSAPELSDVFERSVVLLVRHNEEGAFGLILNRVTDTQVRDVWSKVSESECLSDEPLRVGGPVEGPLMALHTDETVMEMEVVNGIYFSANRDKLEQLAVKPEEPVRYFVGYSGWSAGQLEEEIQRGSWQALPARTEHVFESDERLWERVRREIADHVLRAQLGIKQKHVPPDVTMN
jgi:putative transcriptional regulator